MDWKSNYPDATIDVVITYVMYYPFVGVIRILLVRGVRWMVRTVMLDGSFVELLLLIMGLLIGQYA